MILGIIGAMSVEVETIKKAMTDVVVLHRAGMQFYRGELRGVPSVLVQCGVGKVNAAMCAQILCDCFGVTHIINTGIAGSLVVELNIGDIVIGVGALHHDFDCTAFGYPRGQVPGMPELFTADTNLVFLARLAAEGIHPGRVWQGCIASGDQFVSDKDAKRRISLFKGVMCVEMEGAAIAQTAHRNGVPFVIVRAISDKADDSAEMDYPTFEAQAAQRCAQVVIELAKLLREEEG